MCSKHKKKEEEEGIPHLKVKIRLIKEENKVVCGCGFSLFDRFFVRGSDTVLVFGPFKLAKLF